jgi:lysophospholipase L1-like esterase
MMQHRESEGGQADGLRGARMKLSLAANLILFVVCVGLVAARVVSALSSDPDAHQRAARIAHYEERQSHFALLPLSSESIVFLGDSLTERCEWAELLADGRVRNRGIGGDTTAGVLRRVGVVADAKPVRVFLMIGVNDLEAGERVDDVLLRTDRIVDVLVSRAPGTQVVLQSVLPIRQGPEKTFLSNDVIAALNRGLVALAARRKVVYLDVGKVMTDATGQLNAVYTEDGIHLNGAGYQAWKGVLEAVGLAR